MHSLLASSDIVAELITMPVPRRRQDLFFGNRLYFIIIFNICYFVFVLPLWHMSNFSPLLLLSTLSLYSVFVFVFVFASSPCAWGCGVAVIVVV